MSRRKIFLFLFIIATVLPANPPPPPVTIDIQVGNEDYRMSGGSGEEFGHSVSAGDVNGDVKYDDIIVGAPGSYLEIGAVYIFYGWSTLTPELPNVLVLGDGEAGSGRLGQSVASGDMNGDGVEDIVMGCPASSEGGRVYVLSGGTSLPDTVDLSITTPLILIHAEMSGDRFGENIWTGDVNSDEFMDLLIASPASDPSGREDAGKVYVIYGGDDLPSELYLGESGADRVIFGAEAYDSLGVAISCGDLDADGRSDIVLGVPGGDPYGRTDAGKVHIVFGEDAPVDTLDLGTNSDMMFIGEKAGDRAGCSVHIDDLDADGDADLLIGAPGGERFVPEAGLIYIFKGALSPVPEVDLGSGEEDLLVTASIDSERIGERITTGRNLTFKNSSIPDLVVGSPFATIDYLDPRIEAGKVYMVSGSYMTEDLKYYHNLLVLGGADSDHAGWSIATGNVAGTRYGDLIVGAPNVNQGSGEVYIVESLEFTGIENDPDRGPQPPTAFRLEQNYPNPFNPVTAIELYLPGETSCRITVRIYDIRGRFVKTLIEEKLEPGMHSILWDGRDEERIDVSSGVYLYTLIYGDQTATRKMCLRR